MTAFAFPKPVRARKEPKPLGRKTPLRAKAGISRAKPMRKKQSRRSVDRTPEEQRYLDWLHRQPCVGRALFLSYPVHASECSRHVQQSHARNIGRLPTGTGRKEGDFMSVPMCACLHGQWEESRGWFHGWDRERRRTWMVARIAEHHLAYQLDGGVIVAAASRAERRGA